MPNWRFSSLVAQVFEKKIKGNSKSELRASTVNCGGNPPRHDSSHSKGNGDLCETQTEQPTKEEEGCDQDHNLRSLNEEIESPSLEFCAALSHRPAAVQ